MYQEKPVNDHWLFRHGFSEDFLISEIDESAWQQVSLPHTPVQFAPGYHEEQFHWGPYTYRRHFSLALTDSQQVSIRFEGIANKADFYVDGVLSGSCEGAYLPYTLDLGTRSSFTLTVVASGDEDPSFPPFGGSMDYISFCGIYREASLIIRENRYFTFLGVESHQTDSLSLKGRAEASDGQDVVATLREGSTVLAETSAIIEMGVFSLKMEGLTLHPWTLEDPFLYTIEVKLGQSDKRVLTFGSRSARFTKDGFFLNGTLIPLVGLNRHQDYPYLGYAAPPSLQREDASILKKLGVNLVRTSHYPQHPAFLDACDRLGLLVFEEIPGWQHIGKEKHWRERCVRNVQGMIERDYNHPSIILWGVRINESPDDENLYQETNRVARTLDPHRATAGVRNLKKSQFLEDVYTYNDFSYAGKGRPLQKKSRVCEKAVPYMVSEFCGHMYPCKSFDSPKMRAEHALRHARVLDQGLATEGLSGVIGWCMHDYFTHANFGSGDQICYHGVMDIFRTDKAAAHIYRSQKNSPYVLSVLSSMDGGDYQGAMLPSAVIATNCEEVRLRYNDRVVGVFQPERKMFPHLSHPPVIIDDFIGDRLQAEPNLRERERPSLARLLGKVGRQGGSLKTGDLLKMGLFLKKHQLRYQDAVDLFTRYVGNWGSEGGLWVFEGLVGGKVVVTETCSQGGKPSLHLIADRSNLSTKEATYDMVSVRVEVRKEGGHLPLPYAHIPLLVSVSGVLSLATPPQMSTIGGSAVIYLRTMGGVGESVLHVSSPVGDKTLQFTVV
nr:glycoside hydrolase family 2 TIM barrel-domain containing protein [uncultured Sphaerochaeta sp.]